MFRGLKVGVTEEGEVLSTDDLEDSLRRLIYTFQGPEARQRISSSSQH